MKDERTHYTTPAIISIVILAILLVIGIYLLVNKNIFANQALLTTSPGTEVTTAPTETPSTTAPATPEVAPTGI
jgi:hypothetical protein